MRTSIDLAANMISGCEPRLPHIDPPPRNVNQGRFSSYPWSSSRGEGHLGGGCQHCRCHHSPRPLSRSLSGWATDCGMRLLAVSWRHGSSPQRLALSLERIPGVHPVSASRMRLQRSCYVPFSQFSADHPTRPSVQRIFHRLYPSQ